MAPSPGQRKDLPYLVRWEQQEEVVLATDPWGGARIGSVMELWAPRTYDSLVGRVLLVLNY